MRYIIKPQFKTTLKSFNVFNKNSFYIDNDGNIYKIEKFIDVEYKFNTLYIYDILEKPTKLSVKVPIFIKLKEKLENRIECDVCIDDFAGNSYQAGCWLFTNEKDTISGCTGYQYLNLDKLPFIGFYCEFNDKSLYEKFMSYFNIDLYDYVNAFKNIIENKTEKDKFYFYLNDKIEEISKINKIKGIEILPDNLL